MVYTKEERIRIIQCFYESGKSTVTTQRKLREMYGQWQSGDLRNADERFLFIKLMPDPDQTIQVGYENELVRILHLGVGGACFSERAKGGLQGQGFCHIVSPESETSSKGTNVP